MAWDGCRDALREAFLARLQAHVAGSNSRMLESEVQEVGEMGWDIVEDQGSVGQNTSGMQNDN